MNQKPSSKGRKGVGHKVQRWLTTSSMIKRLSGKREVPVATPSAGPGRFSYIKLRHSDSIRILRLYPGKDRDLLKCTLSEIRTRSLPKYEALSYTWGPNEFPKRITDGDSGADIAITNNLFDAFQVLRLEEESRLLWIDAVCINQNDDVEKSGQVAMMSSIYQNADSVLVWLGSAPEDRAGVLHYLGSLPEASKANFKLKNQGGLVYLRTPDLETTNSEPVFEKSHSALSDAITAGVGTIFESKWFTRVWIVQEYILAKKLKILYGHQVLDEEHFKQAVEFIMALMKVAGFKEELKNINQAWSLICSRYHFNVLNLPGVFHENSKVYFETALLNFRKQDCYDDRDRVYGYLALGKDMPVITPDYTKNTTEVYIDFAVKNLNETTLFKGGSARRGPALASELSIVLDDNYLPSWCPDFRRHADPWEPMFENYFATSNSIHIQLAWTRTSTNVAVLTSYGLPFDMVQTIVPRNADPAFDPVSTTGSFFTMISHLQLIQSRIAKDFMYPTYEMVEMALGITLAGGIPGLPGDLGSHPLVHLMTPDSNLPNLFQNLWTSYLAHCVAPTGSIHLKVLALRAKNTDTIPADFTSDMTSEERLTWLYHAHLAKLLKTHDLFRGRQSYFGLAPPGTQPGDQIAMLSGHRTPFLLRKAPVPEVSVERCCGVKHTRIVGDTVEYWMVLGPVYVHGIMGGELYSDPVWKQRFPWEMKEVFPGVKVPIPGAFCHLI